MIYQPDENRYHTMEYRRCGRSGVKLPAISLGLWHNFGDTTRVENSRALLQRAFDLGITHFDLANNYGPPPGSAECNFGRILQEDFLPWRDELIISTKAGYTMWDGPYGDWGSRKYLIASLDQSLKRMGLEYVDIFYHHRPDPETPLKETMKALDHLVRHGKALYVGISNYPADLARQAIDILEDLGTPCLIHQPKYSLFERWVEDGLLALLQEKGVGSIAFSPLAGGQLTDRYLNGIPEDSRAASAMSTVSMSIVGAYMTMLAPKYVVAALVLNMFSTFIVLSLINPYVVDASEENIQMSNLHEGQSFFEMLGEYILAGFKVAIIVAAMLIGFIALIAALNALFATVTGWFGYSISFQGILGYIFYPVAWVMGVPSSEALQVGSIMATKLVSNEFVAMMDLQKIASTLSPRAEGIISVFLVSFANFSSIGIIAGAIKGLNEEQGNVVSRFGLKLVYGSTLVSVLSASIAALVL
ncbi:hypothetical protein C5W25_001838 [Salmonella enterica subsp. enterica serovar Typhimurium]|nr:hypothetical protein [Salmonella enterica subsp. enterica serovar Typhimurium]